MLYNEKNIIKLTKAATLGALLQVLSIVHVTSADDDYFNDCDKYCYTSCGENFSGFQFAKCVEAHLKCSCNVRVDFQNPIAIIIIAGAVVIVLLLVVCCCRCMSARKTYVPLEGTIVEEPIAKTFPLVADGEASNFPERSSRKEYRVQFSNCSPPSKPHSPREYSPPPPYFESIINTDPNQRNYGT